MRQMQKGKPQQSITDSMFTILFQKALGFGLTERVFRFMVK